MTALKCDICGGSLSMDASGEFATCDNCGMKHTKERVQTKVQEIKGNVSVEGAVETVMGDAEKERLLTAAEECLNANQFDAAKNCYERVAKDYPNDYRGWFGLIRSGCSNTSYKYITGQEASYFSKAYAFAPDNIKQQLNTIKTSRDKIALRSKAINDCKIQKVNLQAQIETLTNASNSIMYQIQAKTSEKDSTNKDMTKYYVKLGISAAVFIFFLLGFFGAMDAEEYIGCAITAFVMLLCIPGMFPNAKTKLAIQRRKFLSNQISNLQQQSTTLVGQIRNARQQMAQLDNQLQNL